MDTDSSSVTESLQKLVRHAEFTTRSMKWVNIVLAVLLLVLLVSSGFLVYLKTRPAPTPKTPPLDWYDVTQSRRQGDLPKALKLANELLTKNPRDFDGLYQKGEILLILDDKEGALQSFQAAADIFPIFKYKSAVDALKKP